MYTIYIPNAYLTVTHTKVRRSGFKQFILEIKSINKVLSFPQLWTKEDNPDVLHLYYKSNKTWLRIIHLSTKEKIGLVKPFDLTQGSLRIQIKTKTWHLWQSVFKNAPEKVFWSFKCIIPYSNSFHIVFTRKYVF